MGEMGEKEDSEGYSQPNCREQQVTRKIFQKSSRHPLALVVYDTF